MTITKFFQKKVQINSKTHKTYFGDQKHLSFVFLSKKSYRIVHFRKNLRFCAQIRSYTGVFLAFLFLRNLFMCFGIYLRLFLKKKCVMVILVGFYLKPQQFSLILVRVSKKCISNPNFV